MRALIFEHCSSKYARKFYEAVDAQSFHLTSYRTSWEKKVCGEAVAEAKHGRKMLQQPRHRAQAQTMARKQDAFMENTPLHITRIFASLLQDKPASQKPNLVVSSGISTKAITMPPGWWLHVGDKLVGEATCTWRCPATQTRCTTRLK